MDNENTSQEPEAPVDPLVQQQEDIALTEAALLDKCADLSRLLSVLQELYHQAQSQTRAEVEILRVENDCLRQLIGERDQQLAGVAQGHPLSEQQLAGTAAGPPLFPTSDAPPATLRDEVNALRQQLQEKDSLIEKLRKAPQGPAAAASSPEATDAADYEAELNEFRRELEADRQALNAEIAQLRARNAELNDAAREAELELSRERAQLARERAQIDRLREEIRQELERGQRDADIHERLAPVQRLKDEVAERHRPPDSGSNPGTQAQREAASTTARWKSILGRLGDSHG